MNLNTLVRRIKRSIGLYGIALPIDNLDQLILDILYDTTIPVFSIYCPREELVYVDIYDLAHNNRERGETCDLFILPDWIFLEKKVLFVKDVKYDENFLRHNYFPTSLSTNSFDVFEDIMLSNATKPITDTIVNSITFHYEHPRKLYIYDSLVSSKLRISLACQHDNSLQSITPTSEESFFKLAILDVKDGLYQTVKHYDGIETSYGRIELKIEDWANARQERDEMLKEWDDSYLLDQVDYNYG